MASITLRIVDGPQRGKSFADLPLPVTIGREKGNTIDIDDVRISRFHLKIFQEENVTLLVDLGSTNGTKVNGETTQIWALRPGDLILLGNSLLLFGTQLEIAARLREVRTRYNGDEAMLMGVVPSEIKELIKPRRAPDFAAMPTAALVLEEEFCRQSAMTSEDLALLRALFPPELPKGLSPGQEAALYKYLLYLSLRFRMILHDVQCDSDAKVDVRSVAKMIHEARQSKGNPSKELEKAVAKETRVTFPTAQWENLLDLFALLGENMEQISQKD
ncbi:MAG: FHA domain-containing protein [Planctomycetia bacterium]|nr:FHA domain-containing protein [Planctomycetia bacterium]